jgi:hypothetical protein
MLTLLLPVGLWVYRRRQLPGLLLHHRCRCKCSYTLLPTDPLWKQMPMDQTCFRLLSSVITFELFAKRYCTLSQLRYWRRLLGLFAAAGPAATACTSTETRARAICSAPARLGDKSQWFKHRHPPFTDFLRMIRASHADTWFSAAVQSLFTEVVSNILQ